MEPKKRLPATFKILAVAVLLTACAGPVAAPTVTPVLPTLTVNPVVLTPAVLTTTEGLKLTIVYDNTTTDPQLKPDWGFAAVVEYGGHTLLFDTGANGSILLDNMRQLGVDVGSIEAIILSHQHDDHSGGLRAALGHGHPPHGLCAGQIHQGIQETGGGSDQPG